MFGLFRAKKPEVPPRSNVAARLEAIGGQGANSAGKILAEAAVLGMGYAGNHFSSFGSEKRGSPVRSFVRFSPEKREVRSASFIRRPDLLVVFHETMLTIQPESLEGVGPSTDLLVNTSLFPSALALPSDLRCRWVATVDATRIAREEGCGLNAVMLGAASVFLPEIAEDRIREALQGFFKRLPPEGVAKNLAGFREGAKRVRFAAFSPAQASLSPRSADSTDAEAHRGFDWKTAPAGGVIVNPGNSILKDHSVSRKGAIPKFLPDVCFHCGLCDMVCPDYCFMWTKKDETTGKPHLLGIDYRFCKACEKCVNVCPVGALVLVPETGEEK